MPTRVPVFRPPGWKERKPWERPDNWADPRKRGRAGQRERAQVLLEEPFCRICLKGRKHVRATIVDHIVPLEWSRCDERWNKQALCRPCHDAKSLTERIEGSPGDVAQRIGRLKTDWLISTG